MPLTRVRLPRSPIALPPGAIAARATAARDGGRWAEARALSLLGLGDVLRRGTGGGDETLFLSQLGGIAIQQGRMGEAEGYFRASLAAARAAGDGLKEGGALVNLGAVANVRGRFRLAVSCYRRGRRAFRRAGSSLGESKALHNLGMVLADRKRYRAAAVCFRHARARAGADPVLLGLICLNAAEVATELGRLEEALRLCEEARARLAAVDMRPGLADASLRFGEIHTRMEDLTAAHHHFAEALRRGRELGALLTQAEALRGLGRVGAARGQVLHALGSYSRSLALFRRIEAGHELADRVVVEMAELVGREVEARDPALQGHSGSVARLAVSTAREMGFPLEELKAVLVAGYLHDVGKLRIPARILDKPGTLDHEERRTVERHSEDGAQFIEDLELPWDIVPAVRGHHENFDGTGYPERLSGEDIPLVARILRVADVFDALTQERPYRGAWTQEEARAHLRENGGTLYDPAVVEAFMTAVPEGTRLRTVAPPVTAEFSRLEKLQRIRVA